MAGTGYANQAARIIPPPQPTKLTLSGSSSTEQQLTKGAMYTFVMSSGFNIRFGRAGVAAADSDSWPVQANIEWPVGPIDEDSEYFRAIGTGDLYYYVSG